MKIDYPSEAERHASIEYILNRAYPKEEKLSEYLRGLYRQIGFDFLMHGMGRMMAFVLFLYFICIFCSKLTTEPVTVEIWVYVVIFSPAAFLLPMFLGLVGEKEQGMLDLQMTCRYTVFHVLTLRMMIAAIFAMTANSTALLLVLYNEGIGDVLHVIFLSITSVLVYAVLFLILLWKRNPLLAQLGLCVGWGAGHFAMRLFMPQLYGLLAMHVPLLCHAVVWLFMGWMATKYLQKGLRCGFAPLV